MNKRILVTGVAGFIGFHLARRLLALGNEVVGIDNLNDYYDVDLKKRRLELLYCDQFTFLTIDISDKFSMNLIFRDRKFDLVINLAAQAGVRHSLIDPHIYVSTNGMGFLNILEGCKEQKVPLIYASSSSVYGTQSTAPYSTDEDVRYPASLYAATKQFNELMAHAYEHMFGVQLIGLRFFTVYGPWGRPDMALFLFTKAILNDEPINLFNNGDMIRDWTYIDDIVEGILRIIEGCFVPRRIYNIGSAAPRTLLDFVRIIEGVLNKKATVNFLPMQPGDIRSTEADVSDLIRDTGFHPTTSLEEGIKNFVDWYKNYYHIGG